MEILVTLGIRAKEGSLFLVNFTSPKDIDAIIRGLLELKMVNEIQVTSILNKHKKRDDWFLDEYSISLRQ